MAEQSSTSKDLWLLDGLEDFRHYTLELVQQNRRTLAVLTRNLDELIFGTNEFVNALSVFSRSSRHTQIQILVKNTQPAIESNHQLIRLAQHGC